MNYDLQSRLLARLVAQELQADYKIAVVNTETEAAAEAI